MEPQCGFEGWQHHGLERAFTTWLRYLFPGREPKQPPERKESKGRAACSGLGVQDPSSICCDAAPNTSVPPAPTSKKCWGFSEQFPSPLQLRPGCHTFPGGKVITWSFRGLQWGWSVIFQPVTGPLSWGGSQGVPEEADERSRHLCGPTVAQAQLGTTCPTGQQPVTVPQ